MSIAWENAAPHSGEGSRACRYTKTMASTTEVFAPNLDKSQMTRDASKPGACFKESVGTQ